MSTQPSLLAQRSCHQICLVPPPLRTISRPPPSLRPIASRVLEQAHHPCDVTRLLTSEAGAFGLNQKRLSAAGSRVGSGSKTSFVHSGVATVVVKNIPFLPPDDIAPSAPAPPVARFEYKNKLIILANFTRLLTVKGGDFGPSQETSVGCRQQGELRVEYGGRVPGVCDGRGEKESGLLIASIASKARVGWSTLQRYRCKGNFFL